MIGAQLPWRRALGPKWFGSGRPGSTSRRSRCRSRDGGNATLEFAMFAMVAVWLLLAGTDLISYLRSRLRLDEVSSGVAKLVTGYPDLYAGDFTTVFQASQLMAGSIDVSATDGATIVTGVVNLAGVPVVAWRQQKGNAGFTSSFGGVGSAPVNLPDAYTVPAGSSVVAVEVFSSIHPWVLSALVMGSPGAPTLRSAALFQPRASLLSQVAAGARP